MSGHRHLTTADLLAYINDNQDAVDTTAVVVAVAACTTCGARLRELQDFERLVASEVPTTAVDVPCGQPPRIMDVLRDADRVAREKRSAGLDFNALIGEPVETWPVCLAAHPDAATEGLVRRVMDAAIEELDRNPKYALELLVAADSISYSIDDKQGQFDCHSEIWKNRANALRMLGRYEEALKATATAERFADEVRTGAFMRAQIIYTRGTVLFKMGRFVETIKAAREASFCFAEYGDVKRVIHARNLEAIALTEQGEIAESLRVYLLIAQQLQQIEDPQMAARVAENIAVSHRRLGNYVEARSYAVAAQARYRELKADSEIIRVEWTLGAIDLLAGEKERGLARLRDAAVAFEELGMRADAGFVKLALTEELLRLEEWDEAGVRAGEAAETFAGAGAKLHLSTALSFLREAVQRRSATLELVRYVREYVTADEEGRSFEPPSQVQ
jgi:tetratricopeptide (TPR) repeat protein